MNAKEPYASAKNVLNISFGSAKEPYTSAKELDVSTKEPQ